MTHSASQLAIWLGWAQVDGINHALRHRIRNYYNHSVVFEPAGRPAPGGGVYRYERTVRYAHATNYVGKSTL